MRAHAPVPRRDSATPPRQGRPRLALWLACGLPLALQAQTHADFQVRAEIRAGCLVNQQPPSGHLGPLGTLDFGRHPSLSTSTVVASLEAATTLVLACTPGTPLQVSVDGGLHHQDGRRLRHGGGHHLRYRLHRQPGCNDEIPPNTPLAVDTVSQPTDIRLPLHGCLSLPGDLPAGRYEDTLTVTLSW